MGVALVRARKPSARRLRGAVVVVVAAALALAGCFDASVIDARLTQAVQPAAAPATGCVETCGLTLRVTSLKADGTDSVAYNKAFGTFNGAETLVVASASKWLAGAVIMTLVDDGLLSLADTVSTFFPAYVGTQVGSITVAQLMSHTSGMDWTGNACLSNSSTTLTSCAATILAVPLKAAPGTQFAYGGNSMQVAGRIAEIVTGQQWATLAKARVFTPLGLAHTSWYGGNPQVAGGALSSVADYDKFLGVMQRNGTAYGVTVLSPGAVAALETDRIAGLRIAYTPNPETDGYGIGVWVNDEPGGATIASPGLYGAFPMISRSHCYRSMLLQQSSYLTARNQMQTIKPELDRQLACPATP